MITYNVWNANCSKTQHYISCTSLCKMKYEKITKQGIEEMCGWLEFYDLNGYFPFDNLFVKCWKKFRAK